MPPFLSFVLLYCVLFRGGCDVRSKIILGFTVPQRAVGFNDVAADLLAFRYTLLHTRVFVAVHITDWISLYYAFKTDWFFFLPVLNITIAYLTVFLFVLPTYYRLCFLCQCGRHCRLGFLSVTKMNAISIAFTFLGFGFPRFVVYTCSKNI